MVRVAIKTIQKENFLFPVGKINSINIFIENDSYVDANVVLKDIYNNYLNDMTQYNVSNETILKTRNVYNNIFNQLNKENKNFKISMVESALKTYDYSVIKYVNTNMSSYRG